MTDTIFMIHGMMCGDWCWENYKKYFEAKGYRCLTPTLRYHGMDPRDNPDPDLGSTSLLDYAGDLEKEINKLGGRPIIMGHSMGGLLAQMLGARGLGESLVLLAPAAPYGIPSIKYSVLKSFIGVMSRGRFWRKSFRFSYDTAEYAVMHKMNAHERRAAYERMVYESGLAALQIGLWFLDVHRASRVDGDKIKCPVLVVSGSEDRITPAPVVKRVAEKYREVSTYREFENHAHWVIGEPGWEEIAGYVWDWLENK